MLSKITPSVVIGVAAILAAYGCATVPFYFPAFVSRSPSGKAELRVLRNFPGSDAEYQFKVEVLTSNAHRLIYEDVHPASLRLKEVNWSEDEKRVGLLICNWDRPLLLGYNTSTGRSLDSGEFRGLIEAQLKLKYNLSSATRDVLYWACTEGGRVYRERYGK